MTVTAVTLLDRTGAVRAVTLIDVADLALVSAYRWRLHSAGYAVRNSGTTTIYLHRVILDAPKGLEVDHVNHDKLDNRRVNLRLATHAENHQNHLPRGKTSKYRNVHWHAGRFEVQGRLNGKRYYLGRFDTEEQAHAAAVAYRRENAPFAVEATAA